MAHPYWESMGEEFDALMVHTPETTDRAERTALLTWIHLQQGVATFDELSARLTCMDTVSKRRKHLRQALRAMEKLCLVHTVNLASDDPRSTQPEDDLLGANTLVSLTWTGTLWLKRAWAARQRLSRNRNVLDVHLELVEEEEEAGWSDPYWVENVSRVDPDGTQRRMERVLEAFPAITSIFDLARTASD